MTVRCRSLDINSWRVVWTVKTTYSSAVDWKMQRHKYEGNNRAGNL